MPKIKTIAELRKELAAKERKLRTLRSRRAKIQKRLDKVDRLIAALGGEAPAPGRRGPGKAGRKPKRATGKPLVEYLHRVLSKAGDGMRAKAVAAAVKRAGYPTQSKDFYSIVATTLATNKRFQRVARGVYKLPGK